MDLSPNTTQLAIIQHFESLGIDKERLRVNDIPPHLSADFQGIDIHIADVERNLSHDLEHEMENLRNEISRLEFKIIEKERELESIQSDLQKIGYLKD